MPPVTYQIRGGTAVWGALNAIYSIPDNYILSLSLPDAAAEWTQDFLFTSNGKSYTGLHIVKTQTVSNNKVYYVDSASETLVWQNNQWINDAYKTMVFEAQSVREHIYSIITGNETFNKNGETRYDGKVLGYKYNVKGAYKANADLQFVRLTNSFIYPFYSNNKEYYNLVYSTGPDAIEYMRLEGESYISETVFENAAWVNDNYKTITIPDTAYCGYGADVQLQLNYTKTPRLSVDVSTLAGWANLSAGEKNITIVAKAAGFKDSAPSAAVQVTKAAAGETWVLNQTFGYLTTQTFTVNFTSNGQNYDKIDIYAPKPIQQEIRYGDSSEFVWDVQGGWTNEAYRTVVLDSPATGELLTWLQSNATKQS